MGIDDLDIEDEDGPPPGWGSPPLQQSQPLPPTTSTPSDINMGIDDHDIEAEEGPPPGWGSIPIQQSQVQLLPPTTFTSSGGKMGSEQQDIEAVGKGQSHGKRSNSLASMQSRTPTPKPLEPPSPSGEKGQMVCGSCRQLLSYPKGAKYVRCTCCQTVNLVLEEHEIGLVKCEGCAVLVMYPYAAASIKCTTCHAVTEIGAHNRRPPLSEQQRRARRHLNRVR